MHRRPGIGSTGSMLEPAKPSATALPSDPAHGSQLLLNMLQVSIYSRVRRANPSHSRVMTRWSTAHYFAFAVPIVREAKGFRVSTNPDRDHPFRGGGLLHVCL